MCGIIIARDRETFLGLCKLNESRGNYSFGGLYLNEQGYMLQRKEGVVGEVPEEFNLYLGHNRAPTSDVTCFDPNHSHPFVFGDWIVAHNGIIRNFLEIQQKYQTYFEVDSAIISWLLDASEPFYDTEEQFLKKVFEELVGTFGCWIYNVRSRNIYIFRSTNSVFYSEKNKAVSSVEFKDSKMLKDNTLFKYSEPVL